MTKHLPRLSIVTITLCLWLSLTAVSHAFDPEKTVEAVQKKYETTVSLRAKFAQKSYLKVMGQSQMAKGEVFIKKPGKMKWTYSAPDPQVLVSDQETLWLYLPEDKQVTKMKIESVYSSNTPALFLSGNGKLTDTFNIGQVLEAESTYKITLFPKEEEQNIDHLVLVADKKSYQILGASIYDKLGNLTEMKFTEIKVNPALKDTMFQFKAPPGVEVIDFSTTQQ